MNKTLFERYYACFSEEAAKSPIQNKLCAAVLINKKLVSSPKCNTTRNLCRSMVCGSIHAEQRALLEFYGKYLQYDRIKSKWVLNNIKVKKVDLIVMRITADGEVANSRPCYNCLKMMNLIGIKKVYYTTGVKNELICENISEMCSIQLSAVSRFLKNPFSNNCKTIYYQNIMKQHFPKKIKKYNLECFINYNFKQIFKIDYRIEYVNQKGVLTVLFYNENNVLIVSSVVEE